MKNDAVNQGIIDWLYEIYKATGFVTEDAVLEALDKASTPLYDIDHICDHLLSMGVIIRDGTGAYTDEDDDEGYDRSQSDYEQIFAEVISIDGNLAPFIEQIRQIQPPQHREWLNLIPQAKGGNEFAYRRVIEMYLRTVVKISLSYHRRLKTPLAETIQEGCVGLIIALEKYEVGRQDVFPRYFPWWVRQNISRETSFPVNPTVYFPVHVKEKLYSIWETVSSLQSDEDVLNGMQIDLQSAVSIILECSLADAEQYLCYFKEYDSVEELLEVHPLLFSDNGLFENNLIEAYSQKELETIIHEILETLTQREKQILQFRFGLVDGDEHTLEHVGGVFGLTRERIRQIEAKAIRKLQHPKRSKKLKPFWSENKASTSK